METDKIKKIAVLGAGVMGHGIAQVSALAGYDVTIRDIEDTLLKKAIMNIKKSLYRSVTRERMSQEEMDEALSRISTTLELDKAVKDAQLVIEAIPEVMKIKHIVWKEVNEIASKEIIFASNTSSLSISKIAKVIDNPERFIGMHFFNPPTIMKLVEVNLGKKTGEQTVITIQKVAEKMGKTPVLVKKDAPGFIVNRILITYLNHAASLVNKYEKEMIDAAMQHKVGMPLGPFMLCDLIGLDIVYNILRVFEDNLGSKYTPNKHITSLYKAKKLGRKTGEGFYSYEIRPSVSIEQAEGFDTRLLIEPIVKEAEKVVSEGIADEKSVDIALKLGANMPKGPFELKEEFL
jgi:enoyl-CoA hydratase/3-hydroxyacyl-CoA dehydrogenase